jgi:hypothetical protein
METYQVGSNIDAWCTRCKLMLAHTIEAVAFGLIKRVQCNTCRGQHQYKVDPSSAKPNSLIKKIPAEKSRFKATDFERLISSKDINNIAPYNSRTHFSKGDVISHATFGKGVVVEGKDIQKIEVLFASGPKILIHART